MTVSDTENANRLLEGAYAIESARDNITYYREFAAVYDDDFANAMGYIYPQMLANVYQQHAENLDSPIVDIGCGTGLVAQALQAQQDTSAANPINIDGIDISAEMLAKAASKNLYRTLYEADLTRSLPNIKKPYGAVVSAGTFTFGHLGPEVLETLLALGQANTLYCIGVNSEHYEQQGFNRVLASLNNKGLISEPLFEREKIYQPTDTDKNPDTPHTNDTATVLVYRQR